MRVFPGGGVDGVSEEAVARHGEADHAGHHGPRVHADAQPQRVGRAVADAEGLGRRQQLQGQRGHVAGVLGRRRGIFTHVMSASGAREGDGDGDCDY